MDTSNDPQAMMAAMQQPQAGGGQNPQLAALIQALSAMGGLQDQQGLLGGRQKQNEEFMRDRPVDTGTGGGAALGSLGNVIRSYVGGQRQTNMNQQQQGIVGQQGAARNQYMQALMQALGAQGGGQQPQPGGQPDPLPAWGGQ